MIRDSTPGTARMRALAKELRRFTTREFVVAAVDKLGMLPRTARGYVCEMSRLRLIAEDGKAPMPDHGRGAVPSFWKWVGDQVEADQSTAYKPPERYASVWDYARGLKQ